MDKIVKSLHRQIRDREDETEREGKGKDKNEMEGRKTSLESYRCSWD